MRRFINKKLTPRHRISSIRRYVATNVNDDQNKAVLDAIVDNIVEIIEKKEEEAKTPKKGNKKENNESELNTKVMDTREKIELASSILEMEAQPKVKKVKKDRGLIERVEGSTIILTEDNKELLID